MATLSADLDAAHPAAASHAPMRVNSHVDVEAEDAVDVSMSLDASMVQDDAEFALLGDPTVKVDVAVDHTLVLAKDRTMYLATRTAGKQTELQVLSDGSELRWEEPDEVIHDVKWIDTEFFCACYSSGTVRMFNVHGKLLMEQKFQAAPAIKLDICFNSTTTATQRRVDVQLSATSEGELWVLYADSTVAIIQVQELLSRIHAVVFGPAQATKFRKYALRDQSDALFAAPCGPVRPTIFQSHPRIGVCTVITAGSSPFLGFYHAGNDQNSIIHLAHIATAIASKAAGAVWSFAKSWGWSSAAADGDAADAAATDEVAVAANTTAADSAAEHVPAPIASTRWISDDQRRRCRSLVLSPTGRLAAVSDTLGRIMLVDTWRMTVIRMWKGYRNAQCGWMHGSEGTQRPLGLYLVIYSAQRGIVEVLRARFGPRVLSIAVGANARLFTLWDAASNTAKCMVLSEQTLAQLELMELKRSSPNKSTLMKYFTQNKLQEENFLLHQIIARLQSFAKKVLTDRTHVMAGETVESLLEDMGNLVSSTSVQSLLDTLTSPEFAMLTAEFLTKAFAKLEAVLQNACASRSASSSELSLLWQLQWRHRILSVFIGLQAELGRATNALNQSRPWDSTKDEPAQSSVRVLPWIELARRVGATGEQEATQTWFHFHKSASTLTASQFMTFFSMPFSDPEVVRQREVVALHERSESKDAFLSGFFSKFAIPVLRKSLSDNDRWTFLALAFSPAISSVFAVQSLQQLHQRLLLPEDVQVQLFLEWFFSLPLAQVMSLPSPSLSSPIIRWLQPLFAAADYEVDIDDDDHDNADNDTPDASYSAQARNRSLPSVSSSVAELFAACCRSFKLFHAFVLSESCAWAELEQAKQWEESTLGKYSSANAACRWRVLQDNLSKTMHLSLRIGRFGRLSVDNVESVDDIMKTIALLQLNDGRNTDDASSVDVNVRSAAMPSPVEPIKFDEDSWVASLEQCRNGAQMKNWQSVLDSFPQFSDHDALCCFRASILCAAWNAERSEMHQLDDALAELDAMLSTQLRAAMASHIWEKYIRVHVVTLISFWEESAAGRKPQRGLQPQIARRFFGIIQKLLVTLMTAVRDCPETDTSENHSASLSTDELESDDSSDERDEDAAATAALASLHWSALTERRKQWSVSVTHLRQIFFHQWPPSHEHSALIQSLSSFQLDRQCLTPVNDHLSLILLLDSYAATSVTPVSISKLFLRRGRLLCNPDSLINKAAAARVSSSEAKSVAEERLKFLRQLLRHDDRIGFALAESFQLPVEMIREEYVIFLYQSGKDDVAEHWWEKLKQPARLAISLAAVARARLSLILQRMQADPDYAIVMSILPADIFTWVVNEKLPPVLPDPMVDKLDQTPSLTATNVLLMKCLALLSPSDVEFERVSDMSVLVKSAIAEVTKHAARSRK
ncbi:TPA: hypothetical protein N0F65_008267 [Lagenidium giganteum]|uniref:Rab3-GAP regulatory subunit N-terminal domain-containing protein n=1 Tax=Lagenidium giganteum TaxID=4803 RepID=A0AAV2YSX9_9STRA|nr:TPA: hypothetical protein N0F65_008267 [Lagenidium giganteum]